jgi:hypothetical protein
VRRYNRTRTRKALEQDAADRLGGSAMKNAGRPPQKWAGILHVADKLDSPREVGQGGSRAETLEQRAAPAAPGSTRHRKPELRKRSRRERRHLQREIRPVRVDDRTEKQQLGRTLGPLGGAEAFRIDARGCHAEPFTKDPARIQVACARSKERHDAIGSPARAPGEAPDRRASKRVDVLEDESRGRAAVGCRARADNSRAHSPRHHDAWPQCVDQPPYVAHLCGEPLAQWEDTQIAAPSMFRELPVGARQAQLAVESGGEIEKQALSAPKRT